MSEGVLGEIKSRLSARPKPRLRPPFHPDPHVARLLQQINPQDLTADIITQPEFATATVAGLLLWADCLEESHTLSQEIPSPTGSLWHGIMHRREPDYDNSRYWFGRAGDHPAFTGIYEAVLGALSEDASEGAGDLKTLVETWGEWKPEAFVALVEQAGTSGDARMEQALETMQEAEIRYLVDWTYASAIVRAPEDARQG